MMIPLKNILSNDLIKNYYQVLLMMIPLKNIDSNDLIKNYYQVLLLINNNNCTLQFNS